MLCAHIGLSFQNGEDVSPKTKMQSTKNIFARKMFRLLRFYFIHPIDLVDQEETKHEEYYKEQDSGT
jgi:hypothetical protein